MFTAQQPVVRSQQCLHKEGGSFERITETIHQNCFNALDQRTETTVLRKMHFPLDTILLLLFTCFECDQLVSDMIFSQFIQIFLTSPYLAGNFDHFPLPEFGKK